MLISELSTQHMEEVEELEKKYEDTIKDLMETKKVQNNNIDTLQKYFQKLERELANEKSTRMKLEEEFDLNTKNHEEEVQLRLKFESKLNNMHSIHRDVETKFKRALNEIESLTMDRDSYQSNMKQYQTDYLETRRIKEEKEAEIEFKDERIDLLQKENKIRKEQIENLEKKLVGIQNSVEFKLNIEYIQSEAQKLDFSKYQPEERVDIYEQKFKDLEKEYTITINELQVLKRDKLGFDEILKEREERILRVKSMLTELQSSYKILDKKHSILTLDYERALDSFQEQKLELDDTVGKLKITNKVRNETEIKLNEEIEKVKEHKTILGEKEDRIHRYISEIQKLEKQMFNLRKEKESLESEKSNDSKHFEIQKRQYVEKISSLGEIIENERSARDLWVERFNKEQTTHNLTKNENLKLRNKIKDLEVEIQNMGIRGESEQRLKNQYEEANSTLHKKCSDLVAANENAEREVNTMKILLKNMEDSKAGEMKKYKESIMKENDKIQIIKENIYMEIEDMHAKSTMVFMKFTLLTEKYTILEEENKNNIIEVERLDTLQKDTEKTREETQEDLEKTKCILDEFSGLYDLQNDKITTLEKEHNDMDKTIRKIERETKKKDLKLKEMNEIKDKLKANELKLDQFKDAKNKTFADIGSQTLEAKYENQHAQTDMTLSKIDSLENNLNSAKKEKSKYLQVVKNYQAQVVSSPKSVSKSKVPVQEDQKDDASTPHSNVNIDFELPDLGEQLPTFEKKRIEQEKVQKQVKREQDFKKKIQDDKKRVKDATAYQSIGQYQSRKNNKDGQESISPSRAKSPMNIDTTNQECRTPKNNSKDFDLMNQDVNFLSQPKSGFIINLNNEEEKEQPESPQRQPIDLSKIKKSDKDNFTKEKSSRTQYGSLKYDNSAGNGSAANSYSKGEPDHFSRPNLGAGILIS